MDMLTGDWRAVGWGYCHAFERFPAAALTSHTNPHLLGISNAQDVQYCWHLPFVPLAADAGCWSQCGPEKALSATVSYSSHPMVCLRLKRLYGITDCKHIITIPPLIQALGLS